MEGVGRRYSTTQIYNALKSPQSTSSKRYLGLLASAPASSIDQLLCKISSRARKSGHPTLTSTNDVGGDDLERTISDEWPLHRLLICFDAVLGHQKRRSCRHDLLSLRSFKACVRLVLGVLSDAGEISGAVVNEDCVIYAVTKLNGAKCWHKLMEHMAKLTQRTTSTTKTTESGLTNSYSDSPLGNNVSEHDMSPYLLPSTSQQTMMRARCYGLRGLLVQSPFFGSDLILHDAYRRLLCNPLFLYFAQGPHTAVKQAICSSPSFETVMGKRRRVQQQQQLLDDTTQLLSICTLSSQLLDALCKVEVDQKDIFGSGHRQHTWEAFIGSSTSNSSALARIWTGAILDLLYIEDTVTSQQNDNRLDKGRLFYCLTTVLMKLPPDNEVFIHLSPSSQHHNGLIASWFTALPMLFAQFTYYLQQPHIEELGSSGGNSRGEHGGGKISMKTNLLQSVYTMDVLMRLLTRLCHVSWRCLVLILDRKRQSISKNGDLDLQQFGAKMTGCLTNFLLAFTAYPVSVETLVTMASADGYGVGVNSGMSPTLLSMDLCADVVIRGYFGLTSKIVEESYDLLGPLLETMMQYIQVVPTSWRLEIGPRIAWCVRSQMALLYGDGKLDDSPLLLKFQKLVVYLLHDDGAIDQLAESSTGLGNYIWEPTILQARDGLKVASALAVISTSVPALDPATSLSSISSENLQVLAKSKRALMALEKISRHTRACERLAETNILDLIDTTLIPCIWLESSPAVVDDLEANERNDLLRHAPMQIWSVYGLLVRLLASLAERTSLMRSKLLQERRLVDVIMGLLWCTLRCQTTLYADLQHQDRNEKVKERIVACQHVVVASLQVVSTYRYDKSATLEWVSWKQEDERGRPLTLVSALICILVPWYNNDVSGTAVDDDSVNRYQWMIFSNQMTSALHLLEQISYLDECGKQLIQDNDMALQELSRWLATLSSLVESSEERLHATGRISDDKSGVDDDVRSQDEIEVNGASGDDNWQNRLDMEMVMDMDGESGLDDTRQNQLDINNDDREHNQFNGSDNLLATILCNNAGNIGHDSCDRTADKNTDIDYAVLMSTLTDRIKTAFVAPLLRALTKVITTKTNLKVMILTDGFTRLFGPIFTMVQTLAVEQKMDNSFTWSVATELGEALWKRVDDLERLFQFFGQNDDDINHRHELTAVALAYASFWNMKHWHSILGIFGFDTGKESIVYSTGPFGILCHMLMFDGENAGRQYDHFSPGDATDILPDRTRKVGNRAKQYAAAQILTLLAYSFRTVWQQQLDEVVEYIDQQLQQSLPNHFAEMEHDSIPGGIGNQLLIRTDDVSAPLHVNPKDLRWISPAFNAMLSNHYSEASTDSIHLHDITMVSLQHFIYVSQILQNYSPGHHDTTMMEYEKILGSLESDRWGATVTLIHMADRYGSRLVQLLGERWILEQIRTRQPGYLTGCMVTYRRLKDKHGMMDGGGLTSDSWPFSRILNQCVKAILLDVIGLTESASFKDLLQIDKDSNNLDDIEALCNAFLVLYQRTSV
ncbi:unnamed protein product [Absidia cylindrospora]